MKHKENIGNKFTSKESEVNGTKYKFNPEVQIKYQSDDMNVSFLYNLNKLSHCQLCVHT